MRTRLTMLAVTGVLVVALAATLDAVLAPDSSQRRPSPTTASEAAGTNRNPSSPPPRCRDDQLALAIELPNGPVAIMRHVRGEACRLRDTGVSVRTFVRGGREKGLLLVQEGNFNGLYVRGFEDTLSFRYSPLCDEHGPFVVRVRAGAYTARRRIPACGIGERRVRQLVADFLHARIEGSGAEEFLTRRARSDFNAKWWETPVGLHPLYAVEGTSYDSFTIVFLDRIRDGAYEVGYRLRASPQSFRETLFVTRTGAGLKIVGGRLGLLGP
jgi:hypothetical protein